MADINTKIHPSSSIGVSFDNASDIAVGVHPSSAISLNVPSDVRGGDLVANGNFDTDTDWVKGAGWTITGGKLVATATTLDSRQLNLFTIGESYEISFTVSDYVSGNVRTNCGNGGFGTLRSADGTYTQTIVCAGTVGHLYIDGGTSFTGKIDNVRAYLV